jgi:hypothetical protein
MTTVGGCELPVESEQSLVAGFILLVVLEIGKYTLRLSLQLSNLDALVEVLILSVYRALKLYRESRGRLLVLLLQHNIGYFAICLGMHT